MSNSKARYSDLFLVTFLSLKNHAIISTEKNQEDGKTVFIFEDNVGLQKDLTHFFEDDEVLLRVRSFSKRYRDVMSYIRNPNPLQVGAPQISREVGNE